MDAKKRKLNIVCSPGTFGKVQSDETYRNNVAVDFVNGEEFDEIIFIPNDKYNNNKEDNNLAVEASENSAAKSKINVWVESAVKFLISQIKDLRPLVGKSINLKSKKQMWQKISQGLQEKGYLFTAAQVEAKYFTLERQYKRVALNNNKTGRSRQTCPYQSELDAILKEKKSLNPEYLLDSETDVSLDESSLNDLTEEPELSKADLAPSTSRKRKSAMEIYMEIAAKHAEKKEKNNEEIRKMLVENFKQKEERAERRVALEKQKVDLLERLVSHLEKN